ncbi:hypothetical protein E2C01_065155 [Portunus trituberculatus]|uniref:Uncharacterized protein n=1 Tax=Portunus trituberculatus TaxID=210409 RepID=A0A5B7HL46_PORTR|nr:hypothetical protein [Portunus trituberculatus]
MALIAVSATMISRGLLFYYSPPPATQCGILSFTKHRHRLPVELPVATASCRDAVAIASRLIHPRTHTLTHRSSFALSVSPRRG